MANESILVVDDEEDIVELVQYNLSKAGFKVDCLTSGSEVIPAVRRTSPDLIVLDLMLPGMDGLELCALLKNDAKSKAIPIVMLTAKGSESDIVKGLDMGADDYVTKPFSPKVLLARIKAILRSRGAGKPREDATIRIHDVIIHPGRHEVSINGKPVELTFTEFRLLHALARRPGWVFTRNQIVNAVRGESYIVTERAVDVQVAGLRKKLGHAGSYIETVRGVGYRFKA